MALFSRSGFASRRSRSVAALICIGLMLISINIIAGRYLTARLDLTEGKLYTLSRGTKQTLAKISEPITLRLYYSTRLGETAPTYGVYAERVRELLDQYVTAARGKIRLELYSPQPFSDVEDQAVGFGLQGVPLDQQGEVVYFGLAGTNSTDDQQIVPFFSTERERFLEYDLTRLVHSLAFPRRNVVGLLSTLPLEGDMNAMMQGRASEPTAVVEQLRQLNDVQDLPTDLDTIPKEVDVLMLVHPQRLPDRTLYAIDQFVVKGGKALVFVDPYSETQATTPSRANPPGSPAGSELERLFKVWGLRMVPDVVAGDRAAARRVAVPVPGRNAQGLDYIAWLNVRAPNLNRDELITAELDRMNLASVGIIEAIEGATTKLVPLITTSPESTRIPVDKIKGMPDVAGLLTRFKPDDKRYILAAHLTGMVETAFPDGPPPPPPEPPKPHGAAPAPPSVPAAPAPAAKGEFVKKSAAPINIVVVADTDMLDDRFWAQTRDFFGRRVVVPTAGNGDFVANAVEILAGGEDLVDLRSRGTSVRPFVVVERIQRAADDQYAAQQQALQEKLNETQKKLRDLTSGDSGSASSSLSSEQSKAIEQFRADMVTTRQQLRAVQLALRRDIRRLKMLLEFCDIALIPIVVAVAAVVIGALRLKRRRRRPALV